MPPAQEPPPFAYDPVQQILVMLTLAQGGNVPFVHLRDLQRMGIRGEHDDYARLPVWPLGSRPAPPAIQVAPDMGAARAMARDLRRIRH
jgi:hypothetical protein